MKKILLTSLMFSLLFLGACSDSEKKEEVPAETVVENKPNDEEFAKEVVQKNIEAMDIEDENIYYETFTETYKNQVKNENKIEDTFHHFDIEYHIKEITVAAISDAEASVLLKLETKSIFAEEGFQYTNSSGDFVYTLTKENNKWKISEIKTLRNYPTPAKDQPKKK